MQASKNFELVSQIADLYKTESFGSFYNIETNKFYSITEYHFMLKPQFRTSSFYQVTIRVSPYRGEDISTHVVRANFYAGLSDEERMQDDSMRDLLKNLKAIFI